MSGNNRIPDSPCGWQLNADSDGLFYPDFLIPNDYNGSDFGGFDTMIQFGQFTATDQLFAEQSVGGQGYLEHQSYGCDHGGHIAQYNQHGQPEQSFVQPQTEVDQGNMASTNDGLRPEIPTSSGTSPGHAIVSAKQYSKERARVSTAKCRRRAKDEEEALINKEATLRSEYEKLKVTVGGLKDEVLSLTQKVLSHSECGDVLIQSYIEKRAGKVAGTMAEGGADRLDDW